MTPPPRRVPRAALAAPPARSCAVRTGYRALRRGPRMAGPPSLCSALPAGRQRGLMPVGLLPAGLLLPVRPLPTRLLPVTRPSVTCRPRSFTPRPVPPQRRPPVPERPCRLPRAYGPGCSMATEQNTAGHAPSTARPRPLAAPPARRTLTRPAIGQRRGSAPPT